MKPDVASVPSPPAAPPAEPPQKPEDERAFFERIDRILAGQEPPPLMTTPPEVQAFVDREVAQFPGITPEELQRIKDDWSLQYYHGGKEVLTWQTPAGVAVLAIGTEQTSRVLKHLSPELRLEVLIRFPDPWW
jgi:hypothetical protein